ncbi:polysaccharide deacetylase family protein [Noviherbaspirillum galbum]|uniref:NodB homology domain-containing protein n=1 Tax=Noviherbaspirillum galbum TaxID=2709383 RepID=A0A6B3SGM1_9BURK|nr:polysaccharide deacetylase family protein [Noviherbaspirillum galbum]NEX60014.1 hypothetical protein [Noviherbaspirillum galbum]
MKDKRDFRRSRKPLFKRLGTYLPLMIVLGLGLPALLYMTVMQTLGWSVPMIGINGAVAAVAQSSRQIVLYASPSTRSFFAQSGGNYDTLLVPWRNYFANRKLRYAEVKDPADLHDFSDAVLILPSAVALSDSERTEIAALRSRGGSLLATWASGARNAKGDWSGWQFLEANGARMVGEIPATTEAGYLVLNGESPVTHTQPAGQRIALIKTAETLLRLKGENVAGRFMNWARIQDEERKEEGAIVYAEPTPGASRSVFFAFSESVWEGRPLLMYDVIDDAIQWLQRDPALVRAAWPQARKAAEVIEMDTEDSFPNAMVFAEMAKKIDYRPTFYVLTSVGRRYPDILGKLAQDFEVGYHADVHDSFKGQPARLQEQRLEIMKAEMATVVENTKKLTGFRAPLEGYDATTEVLLQKAGMRHHTADPSRSDARLPLVLKMDDVPLEDTLIILPRTQRDDINLNGQNLSIEQYTKALVDDFDVAMDNGGLGLLSVHTQSFHKDGVLAKSMETLLPHIKERKNKIWLASAGEVAEWWRDRERFKLSYSKSGRRLEFNITVTGKKPLNGASVIMMLPQKNATLAIKPVKIGAPEAKVVPLDEYRASVQFASLQPGDYAYQATFSAAGMK